MRGPNLLQLTDQIFGGDQVQMSLAFGTDGIQHEAHGHRHDFEVPGQVQQAVRILLNKREFTQNRLNV